MFKNIPLIQIDSSTIDGNLEFVLANLFTLI